MISIKFFFKNNRSINIQPQKTDLNSVLMPAINEKKTVYRKQPYVN